MKVEIHGPLADEARNVIRCLHKAGYEAYMVGGCVRDALLHQPMHDIDIATSARPEDVASLFERVIPTGAQHGTVTVLVNDLPFEVTTYRRESHYVEYRKPEVVEYIDDITEDLRRRDFTMNAIALGADGELLDPFCGQADLLAKRIRCVGHAEERFNEDALRMMRGIRFASVLEMRLTKGVWRGILTTRDKLQHIAMERVRDELWKLLAGPHPQIGVALLTRSGLLGYTKEPLGWLAHPSDTVWRRAGCVLAALPDLESPEVRFALLALARHASVTETELVVRALRLSGAQQNAILGVLRAHERLAACSEQPMLAAHDATAALRAACAAAVLADGEQAVRAVLAYRRAYQAASAEPVPAAWQQLLQHGEDWLTAMPVRRIVDLAVSGKEVLSACDRPAGPWVRACLEAAWLEVATQRLPNTAEALMSYIRYKMAEEGRGHHE